MLFRSILDSNESVHAVSQVSYLIKLYHYAFHWLSSYKAQLAVTCKLSVMLTTSSTGSQYEEFMVASPSNNVYHQHIVLNQLSHRRGMPPGGFAFGIRLNAIVALDDAVHSIKPVI